MKQLEVRILPSKSFHQDKEVMVEKIRKFKVVGKKKGDPYLQTLDTTELHETRVDLANRVCNPGWCNKKAEYVGMLLDVEAELKRRNVALLSRTAF